MPFSHEKLRLYHKSLQFVAWSHSLLAELPPLGAVKNQLDRASISIPLNRAEGNAKISRKDRARFVQIAHGSAVECAACLDVIAIKHSNSAARAAEEKASLEVIINMLVGLLSKLECQYDAEEAPVAYGVEDEDE